MIIQYPQNNVSRISEHRDRLLNALNVSLSIPYQSVHLALRVEDGLRGVGYDAGQMRSVEHLEEISKSTMLDRDYIARIIAPVM